MTWLFLVLAVVLAAILVTGRILAHRRSRDMRAWAHRIGLDFEVGPDRRIGIRYLELNLLGDGGAVARNLCRGRWRGRDIEVFDLVRGPGEDDETTCRRPYTCVLVKADLPLIPLVVRPIEADERPGAILGYEQVAADSAAFDAAFQVESTDRKWAADLLHPRQQDWLLSRPRHRLELAGWSCLVAGCGRLEGEGLEELLITAAGFLDNIPDAARGEILGPGRDDIRKTD